MTGQRTGLEKTSQVNTRKIISEEIYSRSRQAEDSGFLPSGPGSHSKRLGTLLAEVRSAELTGFLVLMRTVTQKP